MFNPCVFSSVTCMTPVIVKSWQLGKSLLSLHTLALLGSSVLHHSNHKTDGPLHQIDRMMVLSYVTHLRIIQTDLECYTKWAIYALVCLGVIRKLNIENREWSNVHMLTPHMILHIIMNQGTLEILEKKMSTKIK